MKKKKEKEENKIYLIKDGKRVISDWEFMQQTGMLDQMKQKGITINPTHSFELLKQTRLELFEKAKQNFAEERKMKKLAISDFDISCMYYAWLKGELNNIENWLSDKHPNGEIKRKPSTSDQIEILKYKQFVNNEMANSENKINSPQQIEKPRKPKPKAFELKDFFNENTSENTINTIQNKFQNYRGKKMAILIYLLQSEYKIINITNSSKTQSRKHFIKAFTKDENIKVQDIDKVFQAGTNDIKLNNTDADYINIKKQLNKIIN